MNKIAIFASGGGSNARTILHHFKDHKDIKVVLVVSNNPNAGVLQIAEEFNVPSIIISKSDLNEGILFSKTLEEYKINFVVLAGFLLLLPAWLVDEYDQKILNIHPSLLPKFGGKNMYGMNVHKEVKLNEETHSGMTIHLVNKEYDKGKQLFQAKTQIDPKDSPEDIAKKVLTLEHRYFPLVIENYILSFTPSEK